MSTIISEDTQNQIVTDLKSALVSYFRTTPVGQQLEAEYIKQGVNQQLNDPLVWLIIVLILAVVIYPYFKKR
jgi:hypothetical protein